MQHLQGFLPNAKTMAGLQDMAPGRECDGIQEVNVIKLVEIIVMAREDVTS